MKKSCFLFSAVVKIIAAAAFFYGAIKTFEGVITFTKFTYLSGAFSSFALLLSLVYDFLIFIGGKTDKPSPIYALTFGAALSSLLTAFVYMLFLAPANERGFVGAYLFGGGASLCLHVINPVLTTADFFIFGRVYSPKIRHLFAACSFPAAYALFVFALQHMGVTWNGSAAPYPFLDVSSPAGWFGADFAGKTPVGVAYFLFAALIIYLAVGAAFMRLIRLRGRKRRKKIKIVIAFGGEAAG